MRQIKIKKCSFFNHLSDRSFLVGLSALQWAKILWSHPCCLYANYIMMEYRTRGLYVWLLCVYLCKCSCVYVNVCVTLILSLYGWAAATPGKYSMCGSVLRRLYGEINAFVCICVDGMKCDQLFRHLLPTYANTRRGYLKCIFTRIWVCVCGGGGNDVRTSPLRWHRLGEKCLCRIDNVAEHCAVSHGTRQTQSSANSIRFA